MLKEQDFTQENWYHLQKSLSSLCGFSLFIYDPKRKRACTPVTHENSACLLVHEIGRDFPCVEAYDENVRIALESQQILFYKCQANLSYFVIPIRLSHEVSYAIIGGQTYLSSAEITEFREKAMQWGISSKRLRDALESNVIASEDSLLQRAKDLQAIGSILIESVHYQNQSRLKTSYSTKLTHIANQFKNEPSLPSHYGTLLSSLGILFNLESASVFKQSLNDKNYREVASFGKGAPNFDASALFLDMVLDGTQDEGSPTVVKDPGELHEAGFPIGMRSCSLFPLSENAQGKTILAIFNTLLSDDDTEMIMTFCLQAGVSLEVVELQHKISEQKKTVQSLSALTSFNFHLKDEALYTNLLEQTTQLLDAEQGSLMIFDDEKEELSMMAMTDVSPALYSLFNKKLGEGIAGQVCQSGAALLVEDILVDKRVTYVPRSRYKTPSFLSVPLIKNDHPMGVVSIADKIGGNRFTEEDLSLLRVMGSFLTMAIERSHLHSMTETLKEISITDSLTGLFNRRYFYERLTEEMERTKRHGLPTCLIMLDIDNFKMVNDTYGHQVGDEVLKWLSQLLRNTIRTIDVASRYGGEEFTVILPNTTKDDARIIAERTCATIAKKSRLQKKMPQLNRLTVSVGLASFPEDASSIHELINHSDKALYQAKQLGKNKVVVYKKPRKI